MSGNKGFDPTFPQKHNEAAPVEGDETAHTTADRDKQDLMPEASQPQGNRQSDRGGSGPSESHKGNPGSTRAANPRGRSGSESGGGKHGGKN
jgi:hypothetical protein